MDKNLHLKRIFFMLAFAVVELQSASVVEPNFLSQIKTANRAAARADLAAKRFTISGDGMLTDPAWMSDIKVQHRPAVRAYILAFVRDQNPDPVVIAESGLPPLAPRSGVSSFLPSASNSFAGASDDRSRTTTPAGFIGQQSHNLVTAASGGMQQQQHGDGGAYIGQHQIRALSVASNATGMFSPAPRVPVATSEDPRLKNARAASVGTESKVVKSHGSRVIDAFKNPVTLSSFLNLVISRNKFSSNGLLEYAIGEYTSKLQAEFKSADILVGVGPKIANEDNDVDSKSRTNIKHFGHFIKFMLKYYMSSTQFANSPDFIALTRASDPTDRYSIHSARLVPLLASKAGEFVDVYFTVPDNAVVLGNDITKAMLKQEIMKIVEESLLDSATEKRARKLASQAQFSFDYDYMTRGVSAATNDNSGKSVSLSAVDGTAF